MSWPLPTEETQKLRQLVEDYSLESIVIAIANICGDKCYQAAVVEHNAQGGKPWYSSERELEQTAANIRARGI